MPTLASEKRCVAIVNGAQVARNRAIADGDDEEANMVEPIGRSTAEKLNVMSQHAALQPIAAQQEDFNCARWFRCGVAAGEKDGKFTWVSVVEPGILWILIDVILVLRI